MLPNSELDNLFIYQQESIILTIHSQCYISILMLKTCMCSVAVGKILE